MGFPGQGLDACAWKFENYDLDPSIYDEMFLPDGAPREHCTQVYETLTQLSEEELINIQDRVTRSFSSEGITFTVYGDEEADERTIPVDCLPRVIFEFRLAASRGWTDPARQGTEPLPRRRLWQGPYCP